MPIVLETPKGKKLLDSDFNRMVEIFRFAQEMNEKGSEALGWGPKSNLIGEDPYNLFKTNQTPTQKDKQTYKEIEKICLDAGVIEKGPNGEIKIAKPGFCGVDDILEPPK